MGPIARSLCRFCGRAIELDVEGGDWTQGKLASVSGRNPECPKAPNPDESPMPYHQPQDVIAWRPGYKEESK